MRARKSKYKTNLSTMIYSGGRKGYPIWFASANFPEISRRVYHRWYEFTHFYEFVHISGGIIIIQYMLGKFYFEYSHSNISYLDSPFEPNIDSQHHFMTIHFYNFSDQNQFAFLFLIC